jgi:hypothetical protein
MNMAKTSNKTLTEVELTDAKPILNSDEYAGKGGSFVYDPATGKRTPVPPDIYSEPLTE